MNTSRFVQITGATCAVVFAAASASAQSYQAFHTNAGTVSGITFTQTPNPGDYVLTVSPGAEVTSGLLAGDSITEIGGFFALSSAGLIGGFTAGTPTASGWFFSGGNSVAGWNSASSGNGYGNGDAFITVPTTGTVVTDFTFDNYNQSDLTSIGLDFMAGSGKTYHIELEPAGTPEPSSFAVLGGVLGMGILVRRRRRR